MRKTSFLLSVPVALAISALAYGPALAQYSQPMAGPQTQSSAAQMQMKQGTATQIPVTSVTDTAALSNASVQDKDGNSVGTVQKVETASGTPTAIRVDAGGFLGVGSKVVQLKASKLKYEQDRHVIITDMTKAEIKALPKVQGT